MTIRSRRMECSSKPYWQVRMHLSLEVGQERIERFASIMRSSIEYVSLVCYIDFADIVTFKRLDNAVDVFAVFFVRKFERLEKFVRLAANTSKKYRRTFRL